MHKLLPVRAVAVVALAASAGLVSLTALGGTASAKSPVSATCTGGFASTTVTAVTSQEAIYGVLTGCSSTGKVTAEGVNVTTVNSGLKNGSGTVNWTNGKTTTYDFSVSQVTNACPTYLDQSAVYEESITFTDVGGTAKVTADGSGLVCAYEGSSDSTVYEQNLGSSTI